MGLPSIPSSLPFGCRRAQHTLIGSQAEGWSQGDRGCKQFINYTHALCGWCINFCNGPREDMDVVKEALTLFQEGTIRLFNIKKATLSHSGRLRSKVRRTQNIFPYVVKYFQENLKYLDFHLKPNSYRNTKQGWLGPRLKKDLNIGVSNASHMIYGYS